MTLTEKFFLDCVKAGINGEKIDAVLSEVDFKNLYELCLRQSMSVAVFCALSGKEKSLPENFFSALKRLSDRHVAVSARQSYESKTVLNALEENEIDFLPLKGYTVKELYSAPEMRYSADVDILVKKADVSKAGEVIKSLGFITKGKDLHHDAYFSKDSGVLFEIHKTVFSGKLGDYFNGIVSRAEIKKGKHFLALSPEDLYLTLLGHSAYHFATAGGVGVRHVADIYVVKKAFSLDYGYLEKELIKCGLKEFEKEFGKLCGYFFAGQPADDFTLKLAEHVLGSSVLETAEKKPATEVARYGGEGNDAKKKTFFKMVFPPFSNMCFTYPVLKKAPFLLPAFYVIRWFRVIFKNPKNLKKLKYNENVKESDVAAVKEIRDKLNLDKAI